MKVKCKKKFNREKVFSLLKLLVKDDSKSLILLLVKGFLPLS